MARPDISLDDIAPSVQDALGVAEGVLDTADPIAIMRSLRHALTRAALRPQSTVPALARFGARVVTGGIDVAVRTVGARLQDPVAIVGKDARFRDPAWAQNPMFRLLLEWYLATTKLLLELVEAGDLDDATAPKAAFAAGLDHRHVRTDQPVAHQPHRAEARVRDRRVQCVARARAISCSTRWRTTAGRDRSTARRSRWARTWPPRPARSCSATSSSRSSSTRRRPTTSTRSRCSCARPGSTATTSPTSRRRRA